MRTTDIEIGEEHAIVPYVGQYAPHQAARCLVVAVKVARNNHRQRNVTHDGVSVRIVESNCYWKVGDEIVVGARQVQSTWSQHLSQRRASRRAPSSHRHHERAPHHRVWRVHVPSHR